MLNLGPWGRRGSGGPRLRAWPQGCAGASHLIACRIENTEGVDKNGLRGAIRKSGGDAGALRTAGELMRDGSGGVERGNALKEHGGGCGRAKRLAIGSHQGCLLIHAAEGEHSGDGGRTEFSGADDAEAAIEGLVEGDELPCLHAGYGDQRAFKSGHLLDGFEPVRLGVRRPTRVEGVEDLEPWVDCDRAVIDDVFVIVGDVAVGAVLRGWRGSEVDDADTAGGLQQELDRLAGTDHRLGNHGIETQGDAARIGDGARSGSKAEIGRDVKRGGRKDGNRAQLSRAKV